MGFLELLLVALLVLLFFGAGKLPAIGAGLGRTVRAAKDAFRAEAPADAEAPRREALPPAGAPPGNDPPA